MGPRHSGRPAETTTALAEEVHHHTEIHVVTQQRKRGKKRWREGRRERQSESTDPPQCDGGGVAIAEVYWQVFFEQLSHHMGN